MAHTTEQERADCPVCGGKPFIRRSHDADGMRWSHVECKGCGLRTRGKWVASSSDECPIFFQEVWEEWPRRAPAVPVQLPEPVANAEGGMVVWNRSLGRPPIEAKLYTEQQVRELLVECKITK